MKDRTVYDPEYEERKRRWVLGEPALPPPGSAPHEAAALEAYDKRPVPVPASAPQAFDDELPPLPPEKAPRRERSRKNIGNTIGDFLLGVFGGGDAVAERNAREWEEYHNDPEAVASANARKRMGPMLRQLGFQPSEIASMSAADIREMGKGDILKGIYTTRQKKAEAAAQAAADERKRVADAAEFDRRAQLTGNTSEGKRERAEILSGMAAERSTDQALLQNQLALGRDAVNERQRQEAEARAEARRLAAEERAAARARAGEDRRAQNTEKARLRKLAADQDAKLVTEEAQLAKIEEKLLKRNPDDALPGRGNIVSRGIKDAKKQLLGGSGLSADDSLLMTDLDSLGFQTYSNTAHNAPNAVPEQEMSKEFFSADGTVGGALKAVRERKRLIADTKRRLRAVLQSAEDAPAPGVPTGDGVLDDLGVTIDE